MYDLIWEHWWNSSETRQLWRFDLKCHDADKNYSRLKTETTTTARYETGLRVSTILPAVVVSK